MAELETKSEINLARIVEIIDEYEGQRWALIPLLQKLDTFLNHTFRGTGPSRDQDDRFGAEPRWVDVSHAVDQAGLNTSLGRNLAQPLAVRAVLAAKHEHEIDLFAEAAYRLLPVLCGIANVFFAGMFDIRKALFKAPNYAGSVVDR